MLPSNDSELDSEGTYDFRFGRIVWNTGPQPEAMPQKGLGSITACSALMSALMYAAQRQADTDKNRI